MDNKSNIKQESLVSVIMNCYNGEKHVREAINSVYTQSYSNWEIIFWDNASTDNTQKIATSYDSRLKYFQAKVNTPLGQARNKALKESRGEYVAFLDSDDVYLPGKLEKQVAMMMSGDFSLVYGSAIVIDENGNEIEKKRALYNSGYIFNNLLKKYDIPMVSVMIKGAIVRSVSFGFSESFGYCPDYNLFMKIAAIHNIGIIHDFIVKYRRSPSSLSKRTLHLVPKEVGQTLDELQEQYPNRMSVCEKAVIGARAKVNYYEAIYCIDIGDYSAARSALKPVIWHRWEYFAIYLILFFPIPREWVLSWLGR